MGKMSHLVAASIPATPPEINLEIAHRKLTTFRAVSRNREVCKKIKEMQMHYCSKYHNFC
jgi:hypothetical protein